MSHTGAEGKRLYGLLLLTALALIAGPAFEFLPSLTWQEGAVSNAMVWHDRQRIEQAILLAIVVVGGATIWRDSLLAGLACVPGLVRWALGIGFALGGVSALLSAFPRFAGLEWATLLLLLAFAFILAGQARRGGERFDVWAVRIVVAVSVVIAVRVLMGYLAAILEGMRIDSVALFTSVFSNRRVFGQVASMAIPLLAYPLLMPERTRVERWGLLALLSVWWMLAIASGTRGTWLAVALAAIVLAALSWRACVGWLKVQALALAVGGVLFAVLFDWLPGLLAGNAAVETRVSSMANLSGRAELWSMAWAHIQASPLLGIGPMHLAAFPAYGAHPHNAILQLGAEWGGPAMLALLLPVVYGMYRMLVRLRAAPAPDPLLVCLAAGLMAAGAQAMVDGVIVMPYTQLWLAWILGWAIGRYSRQAIASGPDGGVSRGIQLGIVFVLLLALLLLLRGIFPEVLYRVEATKAYLDAGNNSVPPRYWMVGPIP